MYEEHRILDLTHPLDNSKTKMVRIILNADDFGKSTDRNRAINDSFKQGLICSAGLIVTGKHLQEAVDLIKEGGYADKIHLHVNLSTNLLQEDSEDIPITEKMRSDSLFCLNGKFALYKGLPRSFMSIFKWRTVYHEIVAQYEKFMALTGGRGDTTRVDFHLWYNLTWPVSIALCLFTRKYGIQSVRYVGFHQKRKWRNRVYCAIAKSLNPQVKDIPATNIDYFLSKKEAFARFNYVELYCHPNYKDGVLLDDSPSYLKHERQSMTGQVQMLKRNRDIEFVSWEDIS